jgi:hypothetical protein
MFEQGSSSSPSEVGWEILDNPTDAGIEKLGEILLPKDHSVAPETDQ